jgi:Immunity protein 22
MPAFIEATYTADGNSVPSAFMREVGLSDYEPACIEAIHSAYSKTLDRLLQQASYSAQWLPKLDASKQADAAICVFAPNKVEAPHRCSLEYAGVFDLTRRDQLTL